MQFDSGRSSRKLVECSETNTKPKLVSTIGLNTNSQSSGLTSRRAIVNTPEENMFPFSRFIGENFILMHDNARPRTVTGVRQCLEQVDVLLMAWPTLKAQIAICASTSTAAKFLVADLRHGDANLGNEKPSGRNCSD